MRISRCLCKVFCWLIMFKDFAANIKSIGFLVRHSFRLWIQNIEYVKYHLNLGRSLMKFIFLNTICTRYSSVVAARVTVLFNVYHWYTSKWMRTKKYVAIMCTLTGYFQVDYCVVVVACCVKLIHQLNLLHMFFLLMHLIYV